MSDEYKYNRVCSNKTKKPVSVMGVLFNIILCALATSMVAGRCNRYCYTKWMDRDDPSGKGDYEIFSLVSRTTVCPEPVGIQCQTTTGAPYKSTGKN